MNKTVSAITIVLILTCGITFSADWQLESNMITARDQFAGCVIDDEIVVFGGNGNPDTMNLGGGEKYDIASASWQAIADHPDYMDLMWPAGVEEVSGIELDGKLYVFGAWGDDPDDNYDSKVLNFNYVYDPSTDTWTELADKPTRVSGPQVAEYNNRIYLFGGENDACFTEVEAYDPSTDTWQFITNTPVQLVKPAVAVYQDKAYVIGGVDPSTFTVSTEVMVYDFTTDVWTRDYCQVPTDIVRAFGNGTACPVVGGKVYLAGGFEIDTSGPSTSSQVNMFDIPTAQWQTLANLPQPRGGHITTMRDGVLYVIGGYADEDDLYRAQSTVYALTVDVPAEPLNGRFFWQALKTIYPTGMGYAVTLRIDVPEIAGCELKGPSMADYTAAVWDEALQNWKWEVLYLTLTDLQQMSLGTWQLKLTLPDADETVYEFAISGTLDENAFLPIPIISEPAHGTTNVIAEHYLITWDHNGDQSGADDMYLEVAGNDFSYFTNTIDNSATQWCPGWLELGSAYCKVGYVDYRYDLISSPLWVSGQEVNWNVFTASMVSGDKNYFYVKYSLDLLKDGRIDLSDLVLFCSHWMDALPSVANFDDTGSVDLEDFSIFAQHWQDDVNDLSEHIYDIEISTDWDYDYPDEPDDLEYEFELNIQTDDTVNGIEFTTPAGNTFVIPNTPLTSFETAEGWMEDLGREYDPETGHYEWVYAPSFTSADMLLDYGDGLYTFTIYFAGGRVQQTTAWFGVPDTSDPIPQPTQEPVFTSFNHGDTLTTPMTVTWQPCTDSAANLIWVGIDNLVTDQENEFIVGTDQTQLDETVALEPGQYEAEIGFEVWYQTRNSDGVQVTVGKYSESDYQLTMVEASSEPSGMVWVQIDDPGVPTHEEFTGEMSKYETTNAQYCHFLNQALASGDITVTGGVVYGAVGSNPGDDFNGQPYLTTYEGHSESAIVYSDGVFSARVRDSYDMGDHPVLFVSWYGATAFCNYYGYELPTAWQWQAVADYDGTYVYGCGTTIDSTMANYWLANPLGLTDYPHTTPVGYYPAAGYGMCDMAGNAWEWTSTSGGSCRTIRGGGWCNSNVYCTVSYGHCSPANEVTNNNITFRACR